MSVTEVSQLVFSAGLFLFGLGVLLGGLAAGYGTWQAWRS